MKKVAVFVSAVAVLLLIAVCVISVAQHHTSAKSTDAPSSGRRRLPRPASHQCLAFQTTSLSAPSCVDAKNAHATMYASVSDPPHSLGMSFEVNVMLCHTTEAGVLIFRFQFDPSKVRFIEAVNGSYGAIQSSSPLSFANTAFSTGYDLIVGSASDFTEPSAKTHVCTLRFEALAKGDALRLSYAQVLGRGESVILDAGFKYDGKLTTQCFREFWQYSPIRTS